VLRGPGCPSPVGKMLGSPVQKPTLHRSISTKVLLAEGDDSPFTEHCRHYEDSYRVSGLGWASEERPHPFEPKCSGQTSSGHQGCQAPLHRGPHSAPSLQGTQAHTGLSAPQRLQAEMQNLKDQVQELHRDLTKHHSLIKAEIMGDILHKALQVDAQIASEYASVEGLRAVFQEVATPKAPLCPVAPPVSMSVGYPQTGSGWGGPWPGAPGGPHRLWNLVSAAWNPGTSWEHPGTMGTAWEHPVVLSS